MDKQKSSANLPSNDEAAGGTQAIDRALSVLFSFTAERPRWSAPELVESLGLTKGTVYRLLQALSAANLVRRDASSGAYRLGSAVLDLAGTFLATVNVTAEARPVLEEFTREHGETVILAVLDGTDAIRVEEVRGSKSPQFVSGRGHRIPFYCSASGRALVMDTSEDRIRALWAQAAPTAFTPKTITDLDKFLRRLDRERRQGWTYNSEESDIGIRALASPVRDHTGSIVASISVSAPIFRLTDDAVSGLGASIAGAAKQISAALGASEVRARRV